MKKYLFLLAFAVVGTGLIFIPSTTKATAVLECPLGQVVQSVMTNPGSPEIPAVTEVINHPEVTTDPIFSCPDDYHYQNIGSWSERCHRDHSWMHPEHKTPTVSCQSGYTQTGTNATTQCSIPAWSETVVVTPVVPAIPPTYEDQCVTDTSYDFCPNVTGIQSETPCTDSLCLTPNTWNIEGQACDVPPPPPPTDVCSNLDGIQETVPTGYESLTEDQCTLIPTPPVDVCPNIDGVQENIPDGMELVEGQCVTPVVVVTDICPNIEGTQEVIPSGYHMDGENCLQDVPPVTPPQDPPPIITPPSSSGGGNGPLIPCFGLSGNELAICRGDKPQQVNVLPNLVISSGSTTAGIPSGECSALITRFLRLGDKNSQVNLLQAFLGRELYQDLPITGTFDGLTETAVKQFQQKYSGDVLSPWTPFGGEIGPTGYVYKTTKHKINLLYCSSLNEGFPTLP